MKRYVIVKRRRKPFWKGNTYKIIDTTDYDEETGNNEFSLQIEKTKHNKLYEVAYREHKYYKTISMKKMQFDKPITYYTKEKLYLGKVVYETDDRREVLEKKPILEYKLYKKRR